MLDHCSVCGRALKNPASIKIGIGSTCFKKLSVERSKDFFLKNQLSLFDSSEVKSVIEISHQDQVDKQNISCNLDYYKNLADIMAEKDGRVWAVYSNYRGEYLVFPSSIKTAASKVYETKEAVNYE